MASIENVKIGFIGFGNMASAMADGFIASGRVPAGNLYACAAHFDALTERTDARGMHACADASELLNKVDLAIIAIKPHIIGNVLTQLRPSFTDVPFISVAAGWGCEAYDSLLPGTRHISTIPNTPVSINEGVIVCENVSTLTDEEDGLAHELLGTLGSVVEVEPRLLSAGCAVSGCSPAFIAMVIEALADAAVKHGIPRATAYEMVSQTVAGTAKLQLATGAHPGAMKDAVCSPGGTTIKGVATLEEAGMRSAFIQAIDTILD